MRPPRLGLLLTIAKRPLGYLRREGVQRVARAVWYLLVAGFLAWALLVAKGPKTGRTIAEIVSTFLARAIPSATGFAVHHPFLAAYFVVAFVVVLAIILVIWGVSGAPTACGETLRAAAGVERGES